MYAFIRNRINIEVDLLGKKMCIRDSSTVVLERSLAAQGLFPAVEPLSSTSKALAPEIVGNEHYEVADSGSTAGNLSLIHI